MPLQLNYSAESADNNSIFLIPSNSIFGWSAGNAPSVLKDNVVVKPSCTFNMSVPVSFCEPVQSNIVNEVFAGEYEAGYSGVNLTILDIGANVGAFSLWALHRWPGSSISAYEPNPGTYSMLLSNTQSFPMVKCYNAAVYSHGDSGILMHSGTGDGEAVLVDLAGTTFSQQSIREGSTTEVSIVHPMTLPPADVVKIDVEGAEADIITSGSWENASLMLIEFQTSSNLELIKKHLLPDFDLVAERPLSWNGLLNDHRYSEYLRNDAYGTVFFLRRGQTMMWKL